MCECTIGTLIDLADILCDDAHQRFMAATDREDRRYEQGRADALATLLEAAFDMREKE